MKAKNRYLVLIMLCGATALAAGAEEVSAPGDVRLRHDLELLNDSLVMDIPLTAWPISWGDVHHALQHAEASAITSEIWPAYSRVRDRAREEVSAGDVGMRWSIAGAVEPRIIRSFENTPRSEAEATVGISWLGDRFSFNLQGMYADNPFDGDEFRPDGTYLGMKLGNWLLSAGWQERWWGPGRDGSMILSTNARPMPGIGIQRIASVPSGSKWFRWMGPWTLTSFMNLMDDDREVEDGLLFGLRASFRPLRGFEIGISRTAQWCGDGRVCDLKTFLRLLHGNDNRGANVDPEDEPGNQLGGFDIRWTLPRQIPVALYMQWTAEDTRRTGAQLHQWLEQVGVEHWGRIGSLSHRTHLEVAETGCRFGALGEGSQNPDCAYNHSIFRSGYRYQGRSIGHGMDGDGLSYSIGSTLVSEEGHVWNVLLRHIDINRVGSPYAGHSLSTTPQQLVDIQLSHERRIRFGRIFIGMQYGRLDDEASGTESSEFGGFLRWQSR